MDNINELTESNLKQIASLAFKLWPESSYEKEYEYYYKAIEDESITAFLISVENNPVGFIHATIRNDHVEGTSTKPVCYIEGIYINPDYRRKGIAKLLVQKVENWGKTRNCTEIASDTEIKNLESISFHEGIGFKEINRVVSFAKRIS